MARRRRSGSMHRRSRRGWNMLYKFLTVALIVVAVVMALILFFRVGEVNVEGQQHYSEDEIREVAGIAPGDNMFLINKQQVTENIYRTLPFVRNVELIRHLPSTVTLRIEEGSAAGLITAGSKIWAINASGKLMGEAAEDEKAALIDGAAVSVPELGTVITGETEQDQYRVDELIKLLSEMSAKEMLAEAQGIHLGNGAAITVDYLERFTVKIPWGADYEYKLRSLLAVVDRLENNETGTIDMTYDEGEVHFLP